MHCVLIKWQLFVTNVGVYFMCVGHWHKAGHIVMLYEQMMACPSDSVQQLPN